MDALFGSWLGGSNAIGVIRFLVDVSLRATVLCLLAGAVSVGLRNSSAYARKMIWLFALVGLVLLPPLLLLDPVWNVPIIPAIDQWMGSLAVLGSKTVDTGVADGAATMAGPVGDGGTGGGDLAFPALPRWSVVLLLVWTAGAVAVTGWYILSMLYIRRILKETEPVDESWARIASVIEERLGMKKRVPIYRSRLSGSAMTAGVLRPVVILPYDSGTWPMERRRLVLSHELAHVKRKDVLIELVVSFALVLHWFNPFVWLAASRLRIERERDCDNAVLNGGEKPSVYASLLLDIAADLAGTRRPVWQLSTISQNSSLKDRLLCILDPKVDRSTGNRRCAMKAVALILAVIVPLSLFGVWETRADEKKPPEKEKKEQHEEQAKKVKAVEKINQAWAEIEAKEGSAAAAVADVIDEDGIEAGQKMLKELKKKDGYYFEEKEFNLLGYKYLYNGEKKKALGVFKMNIDAYPDSWNVYDSCGEAYTHMGEMDKAKKCYKKSLELNPDNENGKKMLQKLAEKEEMKKEKKKEKAKE
jgi:beta-lactamase regulating signal transducer with metallopeptidase domain